MLGGHLIKTWSASQGAFALSSAEAELYGMVEAVTRAKGLFTLSWEIGLRKLSNIVHLGTDSSAAKSFISRRGLGKMRHLEIRDLWLQKEVAEGKVKVFKTPGTENPADLMTKILSWGEILARLSFMNLVVEGWERESECERRAGVFRWFNVGGAVLVRGGVLGEAVWRGRRLWRGLERRIWLEWRILLESG